MPDDVNAVDARLDVALHAMRATSDVEPAVVAQVAARAVLAAAPAARLQRQVVRAAAVLCVVALGALSLRVLQGTSPAGPDLAAADGQEMTGPAAPLPSPAALIPVAAGAARPIVFELDAPQAHRVQVLGDFNQWSRDGGVMQRSPDGRWRLMTLLPPGRYVYAFLVDGQRFERDPSRDAVADPDFGVPGSELVVAEAP